MKRYSVTVTYMTIIEDEEDIGMNLVKQNLINNIFNTIETRIGDMDLMDIELEDITNEE